MGTNNLQEWRDALVCAQRNHQADDSFWTTDHAMASRSMPGGANGVVEAMMVEALWESMGPLEHAWLERFVPDCRQRYPLETEWVTPRNAAIAVEHYGLTPLFNYRLINYVGSDDCMKPLDETGPIWLALRQEAGLSNNCWQLTQELVLSFHSRDHLAEHLRSPYSVNVDRNVMARLQTLCPSEDWPLALACGGVNALDLNDAMKTGAATDAQEDAVAWLQWWLKKSPNCLDNLAWADFPKHPHCTPKTTTATQLHLDLLDNAHDPRDTFPMARTLYTRQSLALESFAIAGMVL